MLSGRLRATLLRGVYPAAYLQRSSQLVHVVSHAFNKLDLSEHAVLVDYNILRKVVDRNVWVAYTYMLLYYCVQLFLGQDQGGRG
jgi:hypothetical protein